ncbi:MAG: hypothetical protein U0414_05425 [Polyangiaceae bacterium]
MNDVERTPAEDAADILVEVEALLRSAFALESWGRLLVFMRPAAKTRTFSAAASDAFVVEDLQVEEILDEDTVDRVFNGAEIREGLAALATATATLSLLADVDIAEVGGGTFVRVVGEGNRTERVAFLPGTVRTPSRAFDLARDAAIVEMEGRSAALASELGVPNLAHLAFDAHASTYAAPSKDAPAPPSARGSAVVLGSYSTGRRSWVWAGTNPTLPPAARKRATALLDAFGDRTLWEISTPAFFTDERTAWALACVVAKDRGAIGLARVDTPDGFVVFCLHPSDATAERDEGSTTARSP